MLNKISFLERKIKNLEKRISKLEEVKTEVSSSSKGLKLKTISKKLEDNFDRLGTQHLVVFALKLKSKQTKKQLETLLLNWGANQTIHGWFKGGNFSKRLLKAGIVMADGKNSENEALYSLTGIKGIKTFEDLLKKYGQS